LHLPEGFALKSCTYRLIEMERETGMGREYQLNETYFYPAEDFEFSWE
jgi:hypothetical protein